ncbi:hypothetical protein ZWY2020_025843 [Hordeum vulgare]|nr:hypothetical protein ZWY2020_025843 [Hordeum vulgare]
MAYHLRSASAFQPSLKQTPSRAAAPEPERNHLFALVTIDTTCEGLRKLEDIYSCIEEMMCTSSNQVSLCKTLQRAAVEAELGRSLVVLDLCNTMQETLMELKMTVQELLLVLKRGEDATRQAKAYVR